VAQVILSDGCPSCYLTNSVKTPIIQSNDPIYHPTASSFLSIIKLGHQTPEIRGIFATIMILNYTNGTKNTNFIQIMRQQLQTLSTKQLHKFKVLIKNYALAICSPVSFKI